MRGLAAAQPLSIPPNLSIVRLIDDGVHDGRILIPRTQPACGKLIESISHRLYDRLIGTNGCHENTKSHFFFMERPREQRKLGRYVAQTESRRMRERSPYLFLAFPLPRTVHAYDSKVRRHTIPID